MTFTRALWLTALAAMAAVPAAAQQRNDDPDVAVAGGGTLPAGWSAKTDRNAPLTNVKFAKMGQGWHVTLGPAVVLYEDANTATGNYHAVATFSQTKAPAHPEGYGLFVGGKDLQSGTPTYTYFLVRGDGQFLVKQFSGAATPVNVTTGPWTPSDAVNKADAAGKATNELAIGVSGGKASFTMNGKEVFSTDAAKIHTDGIVGFRVNHNLDIHIAGFAVHKM
jgi:hypothetical protein